MESIIYNISNAYFPVTVYLKEGYVPGGAVIATNTHNFAGEYSFDNVLEGQYTIHVVDIFGCTKMINTPPIDEDCEIDGFIECGLTTTTLEVTTTAIPESCIEYGLYYNHPAVVDVRNITSSNHWEVPLMSDYLTMFTYAGISFAEVDGVYEGTGSGKFKDVTHWNPPNIGATNEYNFNARGLGGREYWFDELGNESMFWTRDHYQVWFQTDDNIVRYVDLVTEFGDDRTNGLAVRLVRNSTSLTHGQWGTYTGNNGKVYRTICIGNQEWLADNLIETEFRTDDIISWHGADPIDFFTDEEWVALEIAGVCMFDNDVNNVGCDFEFPTESTTTISEITTTEEITTTLSPTTTETPTTTLAATTTIESTTTIEPTTTGTSTTTTEATTTTEPTTTGLALIDVNYGYLYNWYAAMGDADGSDSSETSIAASGWHLPTLVELQTLSDYLGAGGNYLTNTIGGSMKETSLIYWTTPNSGATNTALFNGRGTGYRNYSTGVYQSINEVFYFWTDWNISNIAIPGSLKYNFETFISSTSSSFNKKSGAAIRLIKDSTTLSHGETGTYTGNDGKVYRTICIGTQEWLADNLCETLYLNGSTITEVTDNATWAALTGAARCAYGNNESNAINP